MGLGKWWLKHGPGSPGSIARALIKDYLRWRAENPDATETELLSYVLQTRVTAHRMLGHDSLSVPDQENLIDSCDGKLERLILAIVHLENPAADQALHTAPKVYRKMTEVINEAVSKIRTKRAPPASKQQNDAPSFELEDYQGAIGDYTKAIELKPDFLRPDFAELYNDRGLAKYHLQDHQGAIADYTKAIGLKPDDAKAYNNRGLAYLLLDQKDKAWADFMRAIELGQRIPQEVLDMCK